MEKQLDALDLRILDALQHDASLTHQELADKIGLSASPVSRRVRMLDEAGMIVKRETRLSADGLGLKLTAILLVRMDRHIPDRFSRFENAVKALPEVQTCLMITGHDCDYLLQIVVPDMEAYQKVLLNKITHIDGVVGVHSSFVLRKVVETTALPLKYCGLH